MCELNAWHMVQRQIVMVWHCWCCRSSVQHVTKQQAVNWTVGTDCPSPLTVALHSSVFATFTETFWCFGIRIFSFGVFWAILECLSNKQGDCIDPQRCQKLVWGGWWEYQGGWAPVSSCSLPSPYIVSLECSCRDATSIGVFIRPCENNILRLCYEDTSSTESCEMFWCCVCQPCYVDSVDLCAVDIHPVSLKQPRWFFIMWTIFIKVTQSVH